MAIDFFHVDGVARACRSCGEENFITNYGIMEMHEDERAVYPLRCSSCGNKRNIPLTKLRGYHQQELRRITVSR